MKKKIIFTCVGIVMIILVSIFWYQSTNRSINTLMNQFENAVNSEDKQKLINCYPDFLHEKLESYLSEEAIKDFHNNVGDIKIYDVKVVSSMDLADAKGLQTDIQNEYGINISLSDYQFITFSYHSDFSESTMQVIKIGNKYYLYGDEAFGEPVEYFIE